MRTSHGLVAAVALAAAVEVGLAASVRLHLPHDGADLGWVELTASLAVGWLLLLTALTIALARRYMRAHASLEVRERQLAATEVTSHEWIWQTSPECVTTYCNDTITALLGYRPADLVGRSLFELIHEDDVPRARAIVSNAVSNRGGWTDVELRWRRRDGELVNLQGSGVAVFDRAGQLVGFRGSRRSAPLAGVEDRRQLEVVARVDSLVTRHDLRIAFQPILDLATRRCCWVEALSRFPDNRTPDAWFAEAHTAGKGVDLELAAIEAALAHLGDLGEQIRISLNASPAAILDSRFHDLLADQPLHRLAVEITEHAVVSLYDEVRDALAPLRARGMHVAVDDTGAGYASFSHVLQLRPDTIKLDRSWLHDLDTDAARRTLVTAAVLLALDLGSSVTAEGVETPLQLNRLLDLGVDRAQGFLIGRPSCDPRDWSAWSVRDWDAVARSSRSLRPA